LTLYYTANTGRPQGITNDTTIAKVRLWILSTGPLCLNSPLAYLNGDECSTKVSNSNCISLGISEIENENLLLSLYPNPTDGLATFNFYSSIRENGALSLEDLTGRIIQKADISMIEGYNNNPIDLRNLSSGVYTLSLQTSHDRKAIRIIKY
jgi:hypothetical protein